MAPPVSFINIDDIPTSVIWRIILFLEGDRSSLNRFMLSYHRVWLLLQKRSSWLRIIHARFNTTHSVEHINLYLSRLSCVRSMYDRLRDLSDCLSQIEHRISVNIKRKLKWPMGQPVFHYAFNTLFNLFKRLINTMIIHVVYIEKRDFHFLLQTRRVISFGCGIKNTRLEITPDGEKASFYFEFSSNTEHFENVFFPILFEQSIICRNVDTRFKSHFFDVVVIELKRYLGCGVRAGHVFHNTHYCLRSDMFWLVNICCSLHSVYSPHSAPIPYGN